MRAFLGSRHSLRCAASTLMLRAGVADSGAGGAVCLLLLPASSLYHRRRRRCRRQWPQRLAHSRTHNVVCLCLPKGRNWRRPCRKPRAGGARGTDSVLYREPSKHARHTHSTHATIEATFTHTRFVRVYQQGPVDDVIQLILSLREYYSTFAPCIYVYSMCLLRAEYDTHTRDELKA